MDTNLFVPERQNRKAETEIAAEALAVCAGCPVRTECLAQCMADEALIGRRLGVFGGTTPQQRRAAAAKRT